MSIKALMYHSVGIPPKEALLKSLYTNPRLFEKQIKLLKVLGFKSLTSGEIVDFVKGKDMKKSLCITFDDAYKDVFDNAIPILKKYGFKAIIFVPVHLVGEYNKWDFERLNVKKPIASWEHIKEALKEGFEIGSHTLTHPSLIHLDDKSLRQEIELSKKILEDKLGVEIKSFCYPYGDYNERVMNFVKEAGYKLAFSVDSGHIKKGDNLYNLKRVHMRHNTNIFRLLLKLSILYR
jgi:peptidoglycan/xylan/chitin deacetylase (PgdA/CDA1 family)